MLKKIGMMAASFCLALSCFAEMSETRRGVWNDVEWLYTVDFDTGCIILEKGILLANDNYDITIDFNDMLNCVMGTSVGNEILFQVPEWNVVFGPSVFEGNQYIEHITMYLGQSIVNSESSKEVKVFLTIKENAFKNCVKFLGFDGSAVIKSIGDSAFEGCGWENHGSDMYGDCFRMFPDSNSSFGEVAFSAITSIGSRAFSDAIYGMWPAELKLPETLQNLSESAFEKCSTFDKITLPSSLTRIEANTFKDAFVTVVFTGTNLKYIGESAFHDCGIGFKGDFSLPEGIEFVEKNAFYSQFNVTDSLKLPSTLKTIGDYAFQGLVTYHLTGPHYYSNLKGTIVLPSSLTSVGYSAFSYHRKLDKIVIEPGLTAIPARFASCCFNLHDVVIPSTVTEIGGSAFVGCTNLTLTIPVSVKAFTGLGYLGTDDIGWPKCVKFEGPPPRGILESLMLDSREIWVPIEYKSQWAPYMRPNMKFAKKVDGEWVALGGKVISNAMRPSDPTIMDIKYKVTSTKDKVNVRILAFEDGNRSFAKVLRPETFVDGTEANVGNGVAANVEHTVSWQVSKDWDVDLAKVSIEVYVQEDNLLPLQLTTIPAMGERAAVTFSRNVPDRDKVMNALYWLYADNAADLTLANGVLKCGNSQLVNGSTLSDANAVSYIYSKMGYGTLSGDTLKYVNELMRTNLNPGGITQYAVKEGAAQ